MLDKDEQLHYVVYANLITYLCPRPNAATADLL